jgi:hypothetical protein
VRLSGEQARNEGETEAGKGKRERRTRGKKTRQQLEYRGDEQDGRVERRRECAGVK